MKKSILICTAMLAAFYISGCADHEVHSTTTTTEETAVHPAVQEQTTTVRQAY